jgi:Transposase, Mutator family
VILKRSDQGSLDEEQRDDRITQIDMSGWPHEQLAQASPDLLRAMVSTFAAALMGAEADAVHAAPFGERSSERTNTRNGYRRRERDTRAGSIELAIPNLSSGQLLPGLAARAAPPGRGGAGQCGRDELPARREYAAHALRGEPDVGDTEIGVGLGESTPALGLLPGRRRVGAPPSDRLLDTLSEKLPAVAAHLDAARTGVLAFTGVPKQTWRQVPPKALPDRH